MEFLGSSDDSIIADPEESFSSEKLAQTQSAVDFFKVNADRVKHFKQRIAELRRSGEDTVITLLNVDDHAGGILAEALMPGHNWQGYRDVGEIPVARGLASKEGIVDFLEVGGFTTAAQELAASDQVMVLVLDSNVALVMDVEFERNV